MQRKIIKVGSRASSLAIIQTNYIIGLLKRNFPESFFSVIKIKTTGDKIKNAPLPSIGGKGLFTKEIEEALQSCEIDMAVHSLKDLPAILPKGLVIASIPRREDPHDALISKNNKGLKELPQGSRVGTSSLRRKSGLLHFRSDLKIEDLRGNMTTRLNKVKNLGLDAIVAAKAGINRLNLPGEITEDIPFDLLLPAAGQGALAVQTREDDSFMNTMLEKINDSEANACVTLERSFLGLIGTGCQLPLGVLAQIKDNAVKLEAQLFSKDAKLNIRDEVTRALNDRTGMENELLDKLSKKGADKIIEEYEQG